MDGKADTETKRPDAHAEPSEIDVIIDAWHRQHFSGCATTEQWNHSVGAKEQLKALLAKGVILGKP